MTTRTAPAYKTQHSDHAAPIPVVDLIPGDELETADGILEIITIESEPIDGTTHYRIVLDDGSSYLVPSCAHLPLVY